MLAEEANLLIMPNLDAANIAFNLLRVAASGGVTVGPILLGADKSGPYSDADRNGTRHPQHDGIGGRRCGTDQRACDDETGCGVILPA